MKRGLGKGLESLLRNTTTQTTTDTTPQSEDRHSHTSAPLSLPLSKIIPDPEQPRKQFDADQLQTLSDSIRAQGVLQPILVRKSDDNYIIIAGERRYLASKMAGLTDVPVLIINPNKSDIRVISLIENIQRENLNPIELANSFAHLSEHFHLTHEQISSAVGLSRASVSNIMRLTKLTPEVQSYVINKDIDLSIAKILVSLDDDTQKMVAKIVVDRSMTVKQTEDFVKNLANPTKKKKNNIEFELKSDLEEKLTAKLSLTERSVKFSFPSKLALEEFLEKLK